MAVARVDEYHKGEKWRTAFGPTGLKKCLRYLLIRDTLDKGTDWTFKLEICGRRKKKR